MARRAVVLRMSVSRKATVEATQVPTVDPKAPAIQSRKLTLASDRKTPLRWPVTGGSAGFRR